MTSPQPAGRGRGISWPGPIAILVAGCVVGHQVARSDVTPAACFGPRMVLQRDMPLPVWGRAAPGERVTVSFGGTDSTATTAADGGWRVTLPPQAASAQSRSLVVRGHNEVRLDDVLVGEVWLCAGQSNMLLPLSRAHEANREIAMANRPRVRFLPVRTAAGGDAAPYTPRQIRDLEPHRFAAMTWTACTPDAARDFSAVGFFLATALETELDVPVGIVCAAVGGAPTEAWISRAALAAEPGLEPLLAGDWMRNPALAGWCVGRAEQHVARARAAGEPLPGDAVGPNHPFKPGFLWESCIQPLVPLAIRGVAWYQGESNADSPARVAQHALLLPALVADWRRQWGRADLPVAVVQLPALDRPDWPAFRETQRLAVADMAHAALIVTIDLGRKTDVHPPDKRPVGERIARWASNTVQGRSGRTAASPLPKTATRRPDGTVVIRFDHAGAPLATADGMPPGHFEAAGIDGDFRAVAARIEDGTIVVTPPSDADVRRVRYAWRAFPEPRVNLFDESGLPVAPFMLDVEGSTAR